MTSVGLPAIAEGPNEGANGNMFWRPSTPAPLTRLKPMPCESLDAANDLPSHTIDDDAAHRRSGVASVPGRPLTASIRPGNAPSAACIEVDTVAARYSAASSACVRWASAASVNSGVREVVEEEVWVASMLILSKCGVGSG